MSEHTSPSSEPAWCTVLDGSDRDWRLISMFELREIEFAINEVCVGKNARCPAGHLEEMHESGNTIIDKVRSRSYNLDAVKADERNRVLDLIWHRMRAYFDGDPEVESCFVNAADLSIEIINLRKDAP